MKITIIIVSLFALAITTFAQQPTTATTDDGRKILLYSDGTWRLLKSGSGEPSPARTYQKPTDAKLFVKAPKGPFGVWINQQKWKQDASSEEDANKIIFKHKKGDAFATIVAERLSISTESLKKIALSNAKNASRDARIVSEEKRTVNGTEVWCLKIGGTMQDIVFTYYGYYYGGTEGSLQVITYTATNLFDEFKADFDEFLNGTQIGQ